MLEDRIQRIKSLLKDLQDLSDVIGYVILSSDGLPIVNALEGSEEKVKSISAMISTMYGAAYTIYTKFLEAELGRVLIEGSMNEGASVKIIVTGIRRDHILAVFLKPEANIGLIVLMIDQVKDELAKLLEDYSPVS